MSEDWLPSELSQKSTNRKLIWGGGVVLSALSLCTGTYLSQTDQIIHLEREPALGEYRFLFGSQALQPNRSSVRSQRSTRQQNTEQNIESRFQRNLSGSELVLSTGQLISTSSDFAPEPTIK